MTPDKMIAAYRSIVEEAFSKGNLSVLDNIIAPNFTEHETGVDTHTPGLQGLKNTIQMFRQAYPDLRFSIQDIVAVDDKVWARLRCTGTQKGQLMDIPPTNKKVEVDAIDIVRFSNDKAVEHWGITDRMEMMQQLGVIQQPQHM